MASFKLTTHSGLLEKVESCPQLEQQVADHLWSLSWLVKLSLMFCQGPCHQLEYLYIIESLAYKQSAFQE